MTGIYKITNTINNKVYIGCSKNIERRWNDHRENYKSQRYNYLIYKAFNKYGIDKFTFEVIEECKLSELSEREKYWIAVYHSYAGWPDSMGYNETLGGEGNPLINDEVVYQLWDEGYCITEITNKMKCWDSTITEILKYYKNYSVEESKKRGHIYLNRVVGVNPRIRQVEQYDLKGNLLNTFVNAIVAEEQTGVSHKNIWGVLNHKQKTAGGYQWRYIDDMDKPNNIEATSANRLPVAQIDMSTNKVICVYKNAAEASRQTNTNATSIRKVCNGTRNHANHYYWQYVKGDDVNVTKIE